MDRAGLAVALGAHARRLDTDGCPCAGRSRCRPRRRHAPLPRAHATDDVGDFRSVGLEQIGLTDQGILDLARQLEPLLARPRTEIAERADGLLTRSLGGVDRLDQQVVRVGRALVRPRRLADVHESLWIDESR